MSTKYYHVVNANRSVKAGDLSFNFHPYEHTGTWLGVLATDNEVEQMALDLEVKKARTPITAITKEEYEAAIKKKAGASSSYITSLANSTPTPGISAAPTAGNPVDTNPEGEKPAVPEIKELDEAIAPVAVEPRKAKK